MKRAEHGSRGIMHKSWGHVCGAVCPLFCLSFVVAGCIGEDPKDCRTGIEASFTSITPCGTEDAFPESDDLRLYLFTGDDVLAGVQSYGDAALGDENYRSRIEVGAGTYDVIAWAGLNTGSYDLEEPVVGVTTREDLLFRLNRTAQVADNNDGSRVWFGESRMVEIPESGGDKAFWAKVDINMVEITNRITVIITGLDNVDDYEVIIEADNGSVNLNNTLAPDADLRHNGIKELDREGLASRFTTLELLEGRHSTLIIRRVGGSENIFRGDLLEALIMRNPLVDLSCDHTFNLVFALDGGPSTYVVTDIYVNQWLVYSYEADLE